MARPAPSPLARSAPARAPTIPGVRPAVRISLWLGAAASGMALALPFLREATWPLAWVGLVPLLLALRRQSAGRAFALGWAAGAVFFAATLYWLIAFGIPAWVLASLFLGLYVGVFGAGLRLLTAATTDRRVVFAAPVLWVALEVARSKGMLAFPWALLGASQIPNTLILQLASVAGPYGISFLVVLVNAALAALVAAPRPAWPAFLLASAALAAALGFGKVALQPTPAATAYIAAVQPNVPLEQKLNPTASEAVLRRLDVVMEAATRTRPDVIILPETAMPGDLFRHPELAAWIRERAAASRSVVITGTFTQEGTNSATAVTPDGAMLGRYDKVRLVAFGERGVRRGREFLPLRTPAGSPGILICFESAFPEAARAMVRRGADLLVVITNDGWLGRTAAPFQHAAMARLRAVETRRFLVTSANTGVSNIIDPYGRVLAATGIFREAVLFGDVALAGGLTPFARYGLALEWLMLVAGAALFVPAAAAFTGMERHRPAFRSVVTAMVPLAVWAVLRPLASTSATMTNYGALTIFGVAAVWAALRLRAVPMGLGWRGLGTAAVAAGGSVAALAWLITAAYARQGVPLPVTDIPEVARAAIALFPQAAVEEIWVRGMVFGAMVRWRGWRAGVLASVAISALWHVGAGPEALALGALTGGLFGLIRARAGNVAGIVPAHAGWEGFLHNAGFF